MIDARDTLLRTKKVWKRPKKSKRIKQTKKSTDKLSYYREEN